ncbi:hypothetical protein CW714_06845 [Methanophagales archaeon]|nr:MAG: hypothetical protein CW714_06845 [Methanophagales archaeon]
MKMQKRCLLIIRAILRSALRDSIVLKNLENRGVKEEDIREALEEIEKKFFSEKNEKWQELTIRVVKLVVELFWDFLQQD